MNRKGRKRADLYEKLYKNIRRNVRAYYKKETVDLIKLRYSDMWTEKRSNKDKEIVVGETPTDVGKEVYYIATDNK
ncbi:hypothetical protein NEAUS03_0455 [Nematocida ausubeli]|nr:hypothetical protein NEAUS03_0455 [Nematocida ausubeli]